ncbi:MAG: fasciclin domain-containing protein [Flavobacteriaceae bacterium]|nr:fasciclin domain-containing protein [Flavobacteriaceae bacterium]
MKIKHYLIASIFALTTLAGCKNGAENEELPPSASQETISAKIKQQKIEENKKKLNSLMSRMMVTPELSKMSSAMVTAQMSDMLMTSKGPITLFAPSNAAFEAISEENGKILTDPGLRNALTALLKNHMVEQDLSSADLLQEVKHSGPKTLTTMGGSSLTVYLEDIDLFVKDVNGNSAKIGKSDIIASNGKVHVLDAVLTLK